MNIDPTVVGIQELLRQDPYIPIEMSRDSTYQLSNFENVYLSKGASGRITGIGLMESLHFKEMFGLRTNWQVRGSEGSQKEIIIPYHWEGIPNEFSSQKRITFNGEPTTKPATIALFEETPFFLRVVR